MLSKDQKWIYEHFDELVNKYSGKYVSVAGGELVAVEDCVKEVDHVARQKYPIVLPSILRVTRLEDFECLL